MSSGERKSKQQASAVELQNQLNDLLAGIVKNFNKGSQLQPNDLFSQLKNSVTDLQGKTKSMQADLKNKEKEEKERERQMKEKDDEVERLKLELALVKSEKVQVEHDKDKVIGK